MNNLTLFALIVNLVVSQQDSGSLKSVAQSYSYIDYQQMREKIFQLETRFSRLLSVQQASTALNIEHFVNCGSQKCEVDIVTISDKQANDHDKVQVYISGALHGNERLGPNIAYYLIEYLCTNFEKDEQITHLLKHRQIIITPMTNAYGYANNLREEKIDRSHVQSVSPNSMDINRDFPYNQESESDCLNTIAGRVVTKLFLDNLFVSALTFHGGTNVISYSWGSMNHAKYNNRKYLVPESPDFVAFDGSAKAMNEAAGHSTYVKKASKYIRDYVLGDMTTTVYPVRGGMEDWGYAAGWDNQSKDATLFNCSPKTYPLDTSVIDLSKENQEHIKCNVQLIELDDSKIPDVKTLGSRKVQLDGQSQLVRVMPDSVNDKSGHNQYNGHINRNIRLSMAMIDMAQPYIQIISVKDSTQREGYTEITWQINGCIQVDYTGIVIDSDTKQQVASQGTCNHSNTSQSQFSTIIKKDIQSITIEAIVDQHFGSSKNPGDVQPSQFSNKPQLHFSKLRTEDNYQVSKDSHHINASRVLKRQLSGADLGVTTVDEIKYLTAKLFDVSQDSSTRGQVDIHQKNSIGSIQTWWDKANNLLNFSVDLPKTSSLLKHKNIDVHLMEHGDLRSFINSNKQSDDDDQTWESLGQVQSELGLFSKLKEHQDIVIPFPINFHHLGCVLGKAILFKSNGQVVAVGIVEDPAETPPPETKDLQFVAYCELENYRTIVQANGNYLQGYIKNKDLQQSTDLYIQANNQKTQQTSINVQEVDKNCYKFNSRDNSQENLTLQNYGGSVFMSAKDSQSHTIAFSTHNCILGEINPDYDQFSVEEFCTRELVKPVLTHQPQYGRYDEKLSQLSVIIACFIVVICFVIILIMACRKFTASKGLTRLSIQRAKHKNMNIEAQELPTMSNQKPRTVTMTSDGP